MFVGGKYFLLIIIVKNQITKISLFFACSRLEIIERKVNYCLDEMLPKDLFTG
jgi:hypothetical protein